MSDVTQVLEDIRRQVSAGPGAFDRLARRRDRKRRNQRIATAVLALILAAAAIGGAVKIFRSAVRQVPANRIDLTNVADLREVWSADTGAVPTALATSDGLVYVATRGTDELEAFRTSCANGGGTCSPVWVADTADSLVGGVAAADGMVYLTTDALYAFSASCGSGGAKCEPLWVGHVEGAPREPVVAGGDVFLATGDNKLYSFPTSCAQTGGECSPNWVTARTTTQFTHPIVADGMVYVAQINGPAYEAFPVDCGTGGAICSPSGQWSLPQAWDRYSSPAVSNGVLYFDTFRSDAAQLFAYPGSCATGGACEPIWTAPVETGGAISIGSLTVSEGRVIVSLISGFVVQAFPADCPSTSCNALWKGPVNAPFGNSYTGLKVSNGVVFAPQVGGGVDAFALDCGENGATCEPLWRKPSRGATTLKNFGAVVATGDRVISVGRSGRSGTLVAFGLPAAVEKPASSSSSSIAPTLVFYLGLAAVAGVLLFLRARRRA